MRIFVFFSLSYISRAVVNLLVEFEVIKHSYAVYHIMYFFWDVLPLSSIMIYHLNTFRAEERESKEPPIDWTRQSSATDGSAENDSEAQRETQGAPKFEHTPSFESLMINRGDSLGSTLVPDQEKRDEMSQSLFEGVLTEDLTQPQPNQVRP